MRTPENFCIHKLVEFQVRQTPNAIAAIFKAEQITYQELNNKANQLAHYLKSLGVNSETLIGVCVDRSLNMLIGLLGVLKAGSAYVPLDPTYPEDRLAFMLEDSQLPLLLSQTHLLSSLPKRNGMRVVCLDSDWQKIEQFSQDNLDSEVTPDDLAYTIYTSGSTGKPKGVQIIHRAVVNLLLSMKQEPGLTERDVLLAVTTISFDIAVLELFLPLIVGARVVIVSRAVAIDPMKLSKTITESGATVLQATPATWKMLLAVNWQGDRNLKILCGGEPLNRHLANQLLERSSSLWNMYGPTETTIWSTIHQVESGEETIPIGRPILNTQIYLFKYPRHSHNDNLELVTDGSDGEIYIGGMGIARGYLNRPEITEERFIDDNFNNEPGGRLYKTGDLGRYLPDGNIAIIGRSDYQVKIQGHRIELKDVEAACFDNPAVKDVVVVVSNDAHGHDYLVAYVVLNSQVLKQSSAGFRAMLKEKLPDYMIPALVVFMDALPLTPNCKVDRQALPAPTLDNVEKFVAPRTEIEKQLVEIWTSVLGVQIGIHQNFFESGGNSLRAALLLNRVSQAFPVELSLDCLFKSPTIAGLAEVIEAVQSSGSTAIFETNIADLSADAVLDETIHPLTITRFRPKHIFLTGATGFVGAFLLHELLLHNPQATIYCLVRADDLESATFRLRSTLQNYEIWEEEFSRRIIPIVGDLSKQFLGLSTPNFSELADVVDVIYHCGAYVNLVYPYTALRDANVGGTKEILRLATMTNITPVHYISTLDVFQASNYDGMKLIAETDDLLSAEGYSDGYSQSKWAAEKLVMAARERGLPVSIYRLGMVTGHSKTGAFQLSNTICLIIKGLIQLGYGPELDIKMSLAPVDYIVQAIRYLSHQPESLNKTFHVLSPHVLPMNELILNLNTLGYILPSIPYPQWQAKLLNMSPDNALTPMASLFVKKISNSQKTFIETTSFVCQKFDDRNTQDGLVGTDILCPPINDSVLKAYLSYFRRQSFL
ncbi:amino acid adenylation domain-containing protein [Microcoleus sp. N9_B4]|uniref:amino acid adenylation domain-containing protein n=1 Tax=Microcoleus sp. N9_B4 TaxID=3055386 RepID=UPI002FD29C84